MRRIWYAYILLQIKKQITAKAFWQGVIFGGSLIIFGQVVHVASVLKNTLDTPLGLVPEHIAQTIFTAVKNGDLVKVVTLLLLISISISILKQVTSVLLTPYKRQVI